MKTANYFKYDLFFLIIAISVFPSFLYVSLGLPSLFIGFVTVLLVGTVRFCLISKFFSRNSVSLLFFVLLTLVLSLILNYYKLGFKSVGSVFVIVLILFLAELLSKAVDENVAGFVKVLNKVFYLLLFFGLVSIFYKIESFNYINYPKSIFTFYEPSHYAITIGPLFILTMLTTKVNKMTVSLLFLMVGGVSQNLTILVFWLIGSWLVIESKRMKLTFIVLTSLSIFYFITFHTLEATYYIERLTFNKEVSNLSMLVYMQGWDEMRKALIDSNFLGLGFQMAGSNSPSETALIIINIIGSDKNRVDGGFLAAKLVIEFGIFGIIFLLAYCIEFIRSYFYVINNRGIITYNYLYSILILSLFVELFFRGQGYFTFGVFLMAFAVVSKVNGSVDINRYSKVD